MVAGFSSSPRWFRTFGVPGLVRKHEYHQAKRTLLWFLESRHSDDYAGFLLERHFEHIEKLIDPELLNDEEVVRTLPRPPRRGSRQDPDGKAH